MKPLLNEIKSCTICKDNLPLGPNPVVTVHSNAKIVIVGQAPGIKVHQTSIPWNDASGKELRRWLQIDESLFYDEKQIAIIPMGFCYPGKGKSGDLPPRPECALHWHKPLFDLLSNVELILLIGQYAQNYYLKDSKKTLTENVKNYQNFLPRYFVLPHPSPRNRIWMKKNFWFEEEVIPVLREKISTILKK
ncbi:uracil-DNA glycosylase family protein [Flavobacterium sp. NRK F10]|uniref:uracil-DNA glycosylase family protein n=1 Tax=Flavobacterium sp. NRK F10 TaxID=2954931 RepID=UPI00209140E3|nr:uracil-DNA glycosylase family protein [Flavobacterium sp. NRK F10]MCO6175734.1 uracil-DNA glycosylase family protein [Flavobacterium sp. NRK F10]